MRHIAEGARVKKPFKPRNQTKKPMNSLEESFRNKLKMAKKS